MGKSTEEKELLEQKTAHLKLDDLMNRTEEELEELFELGTTPTIEEIHGVTDGRVLSGITLLKNSHIRRLVNLPWLPWMGKHFWPEDPSTGKGKNRIRLGLMKWTMFHFETTIKPPLVGHDDVFSLDYDLKGNPWFIRQIRDDLKKLREGLYLGTANFRLRGEFHRVLYFALELQDVKASAQSAA